MTPEKDGRYCAECSQVVVDFSRMSDQEVLNYLKNQKAATCGNFRKDQLQRPMRDGHLSSGASGLLRKAATLALTLSAASHLNAQISTPQKSMPPIESVRGRVLQTECTSRSFEASGTVTDLAGNPLIGATVAVENSDIGTCTDLDGNFQLTGVSNDSTTLIVSYVGFQPQRILIDQAVLTQLDIALMPSEIEPEVCVVGLFVPYVVQPIVAPQEMAPEELLSSTETNMRELHHSELAVFPNPFRDGFTLTIQSPQEERSSIFLLNDLGVAVWRKKVKLTAGENKVQINVPKQLPGGKYVVYLRSSRLHHSEMIVRMRE